MSAGAVVPLNRAVACEEGEWSEFIRRRARNER
jgi:hypothetical protein